MQKIVHGIVHGKMIQLDADPGIEDGKEVEVTLHLKDPLGALQHSKSQNRDSAGGTMADDWSEEDDRILEEIRQDRKSASSREVDV